MNSGNVKDGILYECVKNQVPYVLVGSVRDDGPLPEVYGNVYEGQNAMREQVKRATTVICMASTLHTVATGNMTPSYRRRGRGGPAGLLLLGGYFGVCGEQAAGPGQPFRADHRYQRAGLYRQRAKGVLAK